MRYGAGFRRGEGTPPYAWIFKWGCRAASLLAAVAVCGGGNCPGGMNPSPTNQPKKGYGGESMLRM